MNALARRLDATEGQLWTLALGLVLAVGLAVAGIPPVVHHRVRRAAPVLASAQPASAPARLLTPAPVADVLPTSSTSVPTATSASVSATAPRPTSAAAPARPTPSAVAPPTPAPEVPAPPFGAVTTVASLQSSLAGVAAGPDWLYAATDDAAVSHVYAYDARGNRLEDIVITGQPERHARGISGLAVSADGVVIAADAASGRVLRLDPRTRQQTTVATLVDLPACLLALGAPLCEPGVEDHPPAVTGVAVAANGTIYVADSGQATVWRIRSGGQAEPWSQSIQQASGDSFTAIAVAADGSVLTAVGTDLNPANPTSASLYRIPVTADGAAGGPVLVAKLARGDQPTGLAAGGDGRIFVALHGVSTVLVLGKDGVERARIGAASVDSPMGLALTPAGDLVATTKPASGRGQLVRITVRP